MTTISYRAEIFREGDLYVSRCPDLDVSSFGDTVEEARDALQEAVEAFLEGCELLGTLDEVLAECGFAMVDGVWSLRRRIVEEVTAAIP
ncbi:MAG: type II toxin-antitoxin system HicB family antitoxin [Dehalococcoidia bacterium]|nr:type II toxin-antitoxin system HicB family antitoxin [Dehalococcoidia bacterium]MYD51270.1 type II toxin-antitoxin system HicB family antitoxin [Dehalococcoidia bacterium]